jgi:hypothetical protein
MPDEEPGLFWILAVSKEIEGHPIHHFFLLWRGNGSTIFNENWRCYFNSDARFRKHTKEPHTGEDPKFFSD